VVQISLHHEFDVNTDQFWDVFFDDDFNAAFWPALDLDRVLLEQRREGSGPDEKIFRVQRVSTSVDIPRVVKKLVDGAVGYTVVNEFSREASVMEVRTSPSVLADKIRNHGQFRVTSCGDGRCRRTYAGDIEVKLPLVGRAVEQAIARAVSASYDRAAAFMTQWFDHHVV